MDSLDEQLAQLKLLNSKPLSPKKSNILNVGRNSNSSSCSNDNDNINYIGTTTIMPSINGSPSKKIGPAVPPKPNKDINNLPEVPQSITVRQQSEPLFSKRLQIDQNESNSPETYISSSPHSYGQQYAQYNPPKTGPKMPILHRKQPAYVQQNAYSNMKMTLDNPAILDQQLEALEHHKKQLERKGLLPTSGKSLSPGPQNSGGPKLSSASFVNGELQARTSPSVQMMAKLLEAQNNSDHAYSNLIPKQQPTHMKQLSNTSIGSNGSSSSASSAGGVKLKSQPRDIVYSNIMHQNINPQMNSTSNSRMSNASVRLPGQDLIYSNVEYNPEDLPPPPPMEPQSAMHLNNLTYLNQRQGIATLNDQDDDDLPPPPSPVSSSYSELRRATDSYPQMPAYPVHSGEIYQTVNQGANVAHVQGDASRSASNLNSNGHQTYMNTSYNDYSYEGPASQTFSQSSSASDYYGYGSVSQGSSTYESIYEPINPRPPSQLSSRSNYSLYTSYANGAQSTLSSNSTLAAAGNGPAGVNRNKEAEVEALTDLLVHSMDSGNDADSFGICVKCGERVVGENSGCTAMDQIYHIACFTCTQCQINLQGKPFYELENKPYCKDDYLNTLEKCSVCTKPILERILRATGKPYHPQCFTCIVCGKSLDGVPFTVDATNQNYCIEDFHKKFAPRCCVCKEPIMPEPGQEETVRVVALDRSFHFHCYKCEDCGLILSSESEGAGCYPLDNHVLCKSCNAQRVQALTNRMTTEL